MEIDKIISIITGVIGISITVIKFILDFNKDYRQKKSETNSVEKKQADSASRKIGFFEKIILLGVKMRRLEGIWLSVLAPVLLVFLLTLFWQLFLYFSSIQINVTLSAYVMLFDLVLVFLLLEGWIFLFAHFLLPLQSLNEKLDTYKSLSKFRRNFEIRIVNIKNGVLISKRGDKKNGYGIVLVDKTSAAVVRTETQDDVVIGSGVKILRPNEYVVGCVDLRTQLSYIGPVMFDHTIPNSGQFNELQKQRQQTSGLTLDDFEVVPIISVKFKIKNEAKKSPNITNDFLSPNFDANAVKRAVTRELVELSVADNKNTRMDWRKLPTYLVVNLWREYVSKFKIDDLFKFEGISGLQTIEEMINKRVKRSTVVELDRTGMPTGEAVSSYEYQQLLSCGLEILEVRILKVLFSPWLEEQIIKNWKINLENISNKEEMLLRERKQIIEINSRERALKRFARIMTEKFDNPVGPPENIFSTLQALVSPVRDFVILEKNLDDRIENEIKKLDDIWKWLLIHKIDTSVTDGEEK